MALSGDQKALLRLLAQREQGYEDIAGLMGLSVEEVRARVKDALDAVEREGGEAPTGSAPAVVQEAPEPAPSKPRPAHAPAAGASTPSPPLVSAAKKSGLGSLPRERRVYAIAAGLGAVVLVIVLLATGAIGGDSGSSSPSSSSGGETSQAAAPDSRTTEEALVKSNLTGAVLKPVDGSDASGTALFGKAKKEILLQVEAIGLEPSPPDSSYAIWFYKSPQLALRVGAVELGEGEEGIRVQLPLPEEALGTVAAGVFDQISISLTENAAYKAAVKKAREGDTFPAYTGTEVLRGQIQGPIADIATQQAGGGKNGN